MATVIRVLALHLEDRDDAGPATGTADLSIEDDAVSADARAEGVGARIRTVRVRLPRAKWAALVADLKRPNGETLAGALDVVCPIARDP